MSAYIEGRQGLAHTFLNEVVCDASGRVLVEDRVHQSDLGGAASRFGLGGTKLADGNTPIISSFNLDVAGCWNYAASFSQNEGRLMAKTSDGTSKVILFIPGSFRSSCHRGG